MMKRQIKDRVKGIHLYPKDLREIKVLLPDLQTQKAIVQILERAESLKHKRQQADKLTQEYLKSVFYEMFMNKGFEEVRLGDICEINPKKSEIKEMDESLDISFVPMEDVKEHQPYFTLKNTEKIKDVYTGYTYFRGYFYDSIKPFF